MKTKERIKKMKNILLSLAILFTSGFAFLGNEEDNLKTVAGTIRNDGDGWEVITDSAHTPINVKDVTVENGAIKIEYDFTADKVVSLIVTPDETLMKEGYKSGSSVGLSHSYIFIGKEGSTNYVNPNDLVSKRGNFWFQGVFEVSEGEIE